MVCRRFCPSGLSAFLSQQFDSVCHCRNLFLPPTFLLRVPASTARRFDSIHVEMVYNNQYFEGFRPNGVSVLYIMLEIHMYTILVGNPRFLFQSSDSINVSVRTVGLYQPFCLNNLTQHFCPNSLTPVPVQAVILTKPAFLSQQSDSCPCPSSNSD